MEDRNNSELVKPVMLSEKVWDFFNEEQKRAYLKQTANVKYACLLHPNGKKETVEVSTGKVLTNLQKLDHSTINQFTDMIKAREQAVGRVYEKVMTETANSMTRPVSRDSIQVVKKFHDVIVKGMNAQDVNVVDENVRPEFEQLFNLVNAVKARETELVEVYGFEQIHNLYYKINKEMYGDYNQKSREEIEKEVEDRVNRDQEEERRDITDKDRLNLLSGVNTDNDEQKQIIREIHEALLDQNDDHTGERLLAARRAYVNLMQTQRKRQREDDEDAIPQQKKMKENTQM